jgi:hypothetical protein
LRSTSATGIATIDEFNHLTDFRYRAHCSVALDLDPIGFAQQMNGHLPIGTHDQSSQTCQCALTLVENGAPLTRNHPEVSRDRFYEIAARSTSQCMDA